MTAGRMQRVQHLLRTSGEICAFADLYSAALSNGRNDISELRRRGWEIDVWWTKHGDGGSHCHYQMRSAPSRIASAKEAASAYQFSLFKKGA